ncbi:glucose dehydrogenase [FAD, quinone]-like [Eupeodes corollae]|uniref:glucose dehydrogenase [FAD, quinone]-like n=1 Tax=Eupeodes corollae TaxID=290404 RepID=UPI002492C449|nr:glucose dehydrogenase [FAD, quinone]-like [Eupeodes corollae]
MKRFGFYLSLALALSSFVSFGSCQFDNEVIRDILIEGFRAYNEENTKPVDVPSENESFDFIIVGAGPAGCVLANRLSANPNWSVLLLEAGPTENIVNDMPVLAGYLQVSEANWNFSTTPQKNACFGMNDNICIITRGKMLGGSSAINYMIYSRGNPKDFDKMAQAGNVGWSYKDVLPYFLRSERANLECYEDTPNHNTSGLQSVEHARYRTHVADAFVRAFVDLGYPKIDYTGEPQHGTAYVQGTTLNGHRQSAAKAFVLPILNERKNLRVLTFATVTKILIDDSFLAYGVEFIHRDKNYVIKANKEVILSAGTIKSPQLLMLSGVGPKDVLSKMGIKQLVNVPVGKVLYDHMSHIGPTFTTNSTGSTLYFDRITSEDVQKFKAGDPSTRVSTLTGVEALTSIKLPFSCPDDDRPDVELIFVETSMAVDNGFVFTKSINFKQDTYDKGFKPLEGTEHFTIATMLYRPRSSGSVTLRDKNPLSPPIIDPNYFGEEYDVEIMLAGIKQALRIAETPAMKRINATLYSVKIPECEEFDFGTDEYWRCSIKVLTYSQNHQVGTCKMGPANDRTAVVTPELKVHGMKRLRVADSSVLPAPPTGHTHPISLMIGEKLADMIIKEWQHKIC